MKTKTTATIALCLISLILFTIVTQGQTDLNIWQAASTGNVAVVEEHLAKGADINAQDGVYGVTPLSWAALLGQTQMAELLIQRGANVNSKNRDGATSLHAAAFLGRHEIAALLVQKGANTNVRNNSGEIPADSLKADWGTVQFIVQLLQIQVDREKVESGRAKVAELLSQQGAQTGFAGFTGNDIWSAVGSGDIETIKQQLAKGADINAQGGEYGITPLSWAALLEQTQTAELLIQRGANVNSKNRDGSTSLHSAAFLGRHEIATLLVQKGADVNARNNEGTTAMDALKTDWGTVQFIAQLLQIQVDREKVETGRAKVAELLSQQGAQTGFAGLAGNDIWTAAVLGDIEAVEQQLAKGVDVNAKNKDGTTALHVAAFLGRYEIAALLVHQKGVNTNVRDDDGMTAMDVLKTDWETTQFIAQLLQIQVDREKVETGRAKVAELLSQHATRQKVDMKDKTRAEPKGNGPEKVIAKMLKEEIENFNTGNFKDMTKNLHPTDFSSYSNSPQGKLEYFQKESMIELLEGLSPLLQGIKISGPIDLKVWVHGDAAFATFLTKAEVAGVSSTIRNTTLYINSSEGWKTIHQHQSNLQ